VPDEQENTTQAKPTRLAGFAGFFKSYMSVASVVAASVPIPVASWKLIPMYAQQRGFLTVYASLFCFLLLAFIFSIRHRLARPMFFSSGWSGTVAALPAVFIAMTLGCIATYHTLLQRSVAELDLRGFSTYTVQELLEKSDARQIPYPVELAVSYLGIFIFAELAFVLMAIREYLQDQLRLDEVSLLRGKSAGPGP
jgi:asparagine N-glycosylation enzyme membrane subunit Stt3